MRFNQIYFLECGLKVVYEYNVLTQISRQLEVNCPWAFPSGFAFCQTPQSNTLYYCGGIGDEEGMKRCIEIKLPSQ